jgi:hypothetical protein
MEELKHHEKWTVWPQKLLVVGANKKEQAVKQKKLLVVLFPLAGKFLHLSRRGPTSFERRFLKEFEELLPVLAKNEFVSFEVFLHLHKSARMVVSPHLHVSIPHVEKLADFLMLLLPIFPLTSLGTIQGGLATSAVLELEIRRRYGATVDAALDHHCCQSGVRAAQCEAM